jgi:stage III sporulation protein AE
MKKAFLAIIIVIAILPTPVHAMDIAAPEVPKSGAKFMPETPETFSQGLWSVIKEGIKYLQPSAAEAARICFSVLGVIILISLVKSIPGISERVLQLVGALSVAGMLLKSSNTLIQLAVTTVTELSEYGKLLLPVMTAALAAQGGITASTSLYAGTAFFNVLLSNLISTVIVPMVYVYLTLAVANSAITEGVLGKIQDFIKWLMTWCMKIILYIFTGYISITGVINGSADASAIKAAKLTISGMVPVVGGILSDASETILISANVMKNAAGIYGVIALLAIYVGPFVQIGAQYLLLKVTCAVSSVFGCKQTVGLIQDFSSAMGLLLGMSGTVCILHLISTVCYMKGIG